MPASIPLLLQGLRPLRAKARRRLLPQPRLAEDPWRALQQELDQWHSEGRTADFWWRDDDATEPTEPVRRLIALRRKFGIPLALSVIPASATSDLRDLIHDQHAPRKLSVLQHGYRHRNHTKSRRRMSELGTDRPLASTCDELTAGRKLLEDWPGWQPVLVPPFNRIALRLVGRLAGLGYTGLSTIGGRRDTPTVPGISQVNAHVDILAWDTAEPYFAGAGRSISDALTHLRAKRLGKADPGEATGFMTHCWAHDQATWDYCTEFFTRTKAHGGARWVSTQTAFAKTP